MNDDEMEMQIRLAHEQTATRPIGPKPTERLQAVRPHEHSYQLTASGLTCYRLCVTCGASWRLTMTRHNFQSLPTWEPIREPD